MPNSAKPETEYLLHLIFCALHNEEPNEVEGIDFCALFELAKKQEIFSLINDKLQSAGFVPNDAKTLFKNQTLSELNRMIALFAERNTVFSKLTESKIKFMPLKGLIFKDYYPKESMRQMSDNDILIDGAKREEGAAIMAGLSYKAFDTTQNSDDFFKEPYYTFELHRSLFDEEQRFSPRFENVWENAVQDENNKYLYHMSKDDIYIYSICHMYKHYIKSCCGLRFLVDNYVFLKKEENALNWKYINSELEKYGLSDYEKQTKALSFKVFEGEELNEEEKKLLKNYSDYGIYGNKDGSIMQRYTTSGTLRYYLRRLFPPKEELIFNYPVYEKKPYLLPFILVHRFFTGIFKFRKRTAELKTVKQIKKEN